MKPNGNSRTVAVLLALAAVLSCSKAGPGTPALKGGGEGAVTISLTQDPRTLIVGSKAGPQDDGLPSVDSFWVEIYNSAQLRLYCEKYEKAKDETIRLNAGDFRLVASYGDTLGAGFDKPYYLAEKSFTVHGFAETAGAPETVEAVAKLSNVKLAVNFGENLNKYYSDFYALVRHEDYSRKYVKFVKGETRNGYIPGGNLYLEVYAQLGGNGAQDGGVRDSLVYYRTEVKEFNPNDFVTFNVDCAEREGSLDVNILIETEVETIEETVVIPASAAPQDPPEFSFKGEKGTAFSFPFPVGTGTKVADAAVTFTSKNGIAEAWIEIGSDYLTQTVGLPERINVLEATAAQKEALNSAGITWYAESGDVMGYFNFSGTVPALSMHSDYDPSDPECAAFTLTVVDLMEKSSEAVLSMTGEPVDAKIYVEDYNIWGWKIVAARAEFAGMNNLDPAANISLQYSLDGNTWQKATKASITGKTVYFNDATPLQAGREYRLRVMANDDPDNVGTSYLFTTENPQQVGNAGFEETTQLEFETKGYTGLVTLFTVQWWQLYGSGEKWWAVNSPITLNSTATLAYQDFKTFPTVSVITDGAYSGNSVAVASIAYADAASLILSGDAHTGEIFLGLANDQNEDNWARVTDGHAFGSRPSALRFMYKLDSYKSDPFYVSVKVFSSDGTQIGEGSVSNDSASKSSWTAYTVPVNYTVTNRKAARIEMVFRSSATNSTESRRLTLKTVSGSHDIHTGNVLYLDNVELLYQ